MPRLSKSPLFAVTVGLLAMCGLLFAGCNDRSEPNASPAGQQVQQQTEEHAGSMDTMREHMDHETEADASQAAAAADGAAKIVNTECPVGGHAVVPTVQTVEYEGKTYGFCCADCVEPFKADPAKYVMAK